MDTIDEVITYITQIVEKECSPFPVIKHVTNVTLDNEIQRQLIQYRLDISWQDIRRFKPFINHFNSTVNKEIYNKSKKYIAILKDFNDMNKILFLVIIDNITDNQLSDEQFESYKIKLWNQY